jgi:hypothetical protein
VPGLVCIVPILAPVALTLRTIPEVRSVLLIRTSTGTSYDTPWPREHKSHKTNSGDEKGSNCYKVIKPLRNQRTCVAESTALETVTAVGKEGNVPEDIRLMIVVSAIQRENCTLE